MADRGSITTSGIRVDDVSDLIDEQIIVQHIDQFTGTRGGDKVASQEDVEEVSSQQTSVATNLSGLRNDLNGLGNNFVNKAGDSVNGKLTYSQTFTLSGLDLASVNYVNSRISPANISPLATSADLPAVIAKVNEIISHINT